MAESAATIAARYEAKKKEIQEDIKKVLLKIFDTIELEEYREGTKHHLGEEVYWDFFEDVIEEVCDAKERELNPCW